jgi:hypothetical protein
MKGDRGGEGREEGDVGEGEGGMKRGHWVLEYPGRNRNIFKSI